MSKVGDKARRPVPANAAGEETTLGAGPVVCFRKGHAFQAAYPVHVD
jgi:hypothetical protein